MEAIQTSLSRWDSRWFHEVVERGYFYYGPTKYTSVRYYPLYPLLIVFVRSITPLNTFQAGTIVSSLATLGSLLLLYRTALEHSSRESAFSTIEVLLFFPSAFVLGTVYSDSTTLFCFLLATYFARNRAYGLAGVSAFFSAISHTTGALILLPLTVIAVRELHTFRSLKLWTMIGIGLLGVVAFPGYLWVRFGDPFLFFRVQSEFRFVPVYSFLKDVFLAFIGAVTDRRVPQSVDPTGMSTFPVNFAVLCLMFWTLRLAYLRKRWDDFALMVGACLVATSVGSLQSLARLALVYYPIALHVGNWTTEYPSIRFVLNFALLSAQFAMLAHFVGWHFVF